MTVNKQKLRKTAYIYTALMLALIFSSRTIYNFSLPRVSVVLPESGRLTKTLEARGVIAFSETIEIRAPAAGQISGVYIKEGDIVCGDTVIAEYAQNTDTAAAETGFNIERTENQLAALNLSKSAVLDSLKAVNISSPGELHDYLQAVADAETALAKREAELSATLDFTKMLTGVYNGADELTGVPDGKGYPPTPGERAFNKALAELREAQTALLTAETAEPGVFDDYSFQAALQEAKITLDRAREDMQKAEAALEAAESGSLPPFDGYTYQKAADAAQTVYERYREDYNAALLEQNQAVWDYYTLLAADPDSAAAAKSVIDAAESRVTQAKRALDDAIDSLERARDDMQRAEDAYYANAGDTQNLTVEEAETRLESANRAALDARRAYNNTLAAKDRAEAAHNADAEKARQQNTEAAQNRVKAANDVLDELLWEANQNAAKAEEAKTETETALERARENLDLAQRALNNRAHDKRNALNLELQRIDLDIERVNIDLRAAKSSLTAAADTRIAAGAAGTAINIGIKKGRLISPGEQIAEIGINNGIFICEIAVPESSARFIEPGDTASVRGRGGAALKPVSVQCAVSDIEPAGDMLKIRIVIETDGFSGGEYVTVNFNKQTEIYNAVVPNEAVFSDGTGSFVWTVRSRQGALGTEYYTVKQRIITAGADDYHTAVARGLEFIAPVVISYDKEPAVNGRVRRFEQ